MRGVYRSKALCEFDEYVKEVNRVVEPTKRPRPPRARAWWDMEEEWVEDRCVVGGIGLGEVVGCRGKIGDRTCRKVWLVPYGNLLASGIPMPLWKDDPVFKVSMCQNCSLLYFSAVQRYRCKTRWINEVASVERSSPSVVRGQYEWNKELMLGRLEESMKVAWEKYVELSKGVREVELRIWERTGMEVANLAIYPLTYLDFSRAASGVYVVKYWQEDRIDVAIT